MKLVVKNRFGTIPNEILNSKLLSFKAKGLYGYIQSKPDDWAFSEKRISEQTGEGITSVKSGLAELESCGLLVREKYQDEKGYWRILYILYSEIAENTAENPTSENRTQENLYNNSKQEQSNRDLVNTKSLFVATKKVATNSDKNKKYFPIALELENIITSKKNIKVSKQKLNGWANSIRLLCENDGVPIDRITDALSWYEIHQDDEYVPVIESGSSLRQKFIKLENAIERSKNQRKRDRTNSIGFKRGKLKYKTPEIL